MFSLSYKVQSKTENVFGSTSGVVFATEEMAWNFLALEEKDNYILETTLTELPN